AGLSGLMQRFSLQRNLATQENELHRARDLLLDKVRGLVEQLQDVVRLEILGPNDAFQFLYRLLNYNSEKFPSSQLSDPDDIDFHSCNSTLECHPDHLQLDDFHVRVLTVKEPPSQTSPNLFGKAQEVPGNLIMVSEWKPESAWNMRKLIKSAQRH